jgi:hypothetical protein
MTSINRCSLKITLLSTEHRYHFFPDPYTLSLLGLSPFSLCLYICFVENKLVVCVVDTFADSCELCWPATVKVKQKTKSDGF